MFSILHPAFRAVFQSVILILSILVITWNIVLVLGIPITCCCAAYEAFEEEQMLWQNEL